MEQSGDGQVGPQGERRGQCGAGGGCPVGTTARPRAPRSSSGPATASRASSGGSVWQLRDHLLQRSRHRRDQLADGQRVAGATFGGSGQRHPKVGPRGSRPRTAARSAQSRCARTLTAWDSARRCCSNSQGDQHGSRQATRPASGPRCVDRRARGGDHIRPEQQPDQDHGHMSARKRRILWRDRAVGCEELRYQGEIDRRRLRIEDIGPYPWPTR